MKYFYKYLLYIKVNSNYKASYQVLLSLLKMTQFVSASELYIYQDEPDVKAKFLKILNLVDKLNRYYLSVGIDVDLVELFNFADNFKADVENGYLLCAIFDIACSRISDMNILINCYSKTIELRLKTYKWGNDDYHSSFLYGLCIRNCINGVNIVLKLFKPTYIKKYINSTLFSCICKYGKPQSIPILDRLLKEYPPDELYKDIGYLLNASLSNDNDDITILKWIFEKWPQSIYDIDHSHISSAGFPGNIKSIQYVFSLNKNIPINDTILVGPCYNNNIELVKLLFEYKPDLDVSVSDSVCFLKYAKSIYNNTGDLNLANYLISKRPYKYYLKENNDNLLFLERTNEEENRLKTRYQMLAISKHKNKNNLLWRISDDVDHMIIQYV